MVPCQEVKRNLKNHITGDLTPWEGERHDESPHIDLQEGTCRAQIRPYANRNASKKEKKKNPKKS